MRKNLSITERTFLFLWPVSIVVGIIIFLITKETNDLVSYLLGVFTAMLVNSLHYRILKNALEKPKSKIQVTTFIIYLVKMGLYGFILYFVITNSNWNVLYTVGGFITYRVVFFLIAYIMNTRKPSNGDL
ncbi:MAG: hypothetical protein CVV56_07620 [Tenericutes bacterium HGW-Tenericutes-1]|jgi:quinol-cytochrome oxidoreductase complex cytochrome b subunit|nr:MAG: hypothetical protein CVV56_07620 [Tenericutes bacterium HGW-Tenericutes-1]